MATSRGSKSSWESVKININDSAIELKKANEFKTKNNATTAKSISVTDLSRQEFVNLVLNISDVGFKLNELLGQGFFTYFALLSLEKVFRISAYGFDLPAWSVFTNMSDWLTVTSLLVEFILFRRLELSRIAKRMR